MQERREGLLDAVRQDPAYLRENITLYPFDTLESIDHLMELLDDRAAAHLEGRPIRTMIDIGCANGELGLTFEEAGLSVALLDRSHVAEGQGSVVRQNAPLVASIMARVRGSHAVIFDEDIDDCFDPKRVIERFSSSPEGGAGFQRFGLGVMLGVLYHLKNPYAVMEKLGQLCDHLIVATWLADRLPDGRTSIEDEQVVFLLEDRQLAADPTNYWIFTPRSFRVLVERCGWRVLSERTVTSPVRSPVTWRERLTRGGRRAVVSAPDNVKRRDYMLLERSDLDSGSR